jgi:hypothetical protein
MSKEWFVGALKKTPQVEVAKVAAPIRRKTWDAAFGPFPSKEAAIKFATSKNPKRARPNHHLPVGTVLSFQGGQGVVMQKLSDGYRVLTATGSERTITDAQVTGAASPGGCERKVETNPSKAAFWHVVIGGPARCPSRVVRTIAFGKSGILARVYRCGKASMKVWSILFPKAQYTAKGGASWAKAHGFKWKRVEG